MGLTAMPWWVKVSTESPHCLYYFGPFSSQHEATYAQPGYIEDLMQEGAEQIQAAITRQQAPEQLTVEYVS
ncbi:MAG: DUF1816 domain-containing protein [Leptolyngbya sp. SIO4C1]|nr:DUF1816 domain-containing protein [Leptolyngbya sp. SIO4C1]